MKGEVTADAPSAVETGSRMISAVMGHTNWVGVRTWVMTRFRRSSSWVEEAG